jgi:hypothetical protein
MRRHDRTIMQRGPITMPVMFGNSEAGCLIRYQQGSPRA